jgi:fatty-acyl-CoA synthase
MIGLMQDVPLSFDLLLWRAERLFANKCMVTAVPGGVRTLRYGDFVGQVDLLGGVVDNLGVSDDGVVGSLSWAADHHMALYFGVPCSGRVLHTLNPRFSDPQLIHSVNDAADEVLFVDAPLALRIWHLLPSFPSVRHVVIIGDGSALPPAPGGVEVHDYDDLLSGSQPGRRAVTDENQAAMLCYTSGTTGDPKGVLYSHRSLVEQAMVLPSDDSLAIGEADVVLMGGQMYHANGISLPHICMTTGATLVMPGAEMSGERLVDLMVSEGVTVNLIPTPLWPMVIPHLAGRDLPKLRCNLGGGAATPEALSAKVEEVTGIPIQQIWGMTETATHGTLVRAKSYLKDEARSLGATVGLPNPGLMFRIVDEEGTELPWDGTAAGELQVRGLWVAGSYLKVSGTDGFTSDGWLRTGDLATIDPEGYIRVMDRIKDVIKSGGLWVSSLDLEALLSGHPSVSEVAVIGVPDERWDERPIAVVVPSDGHDVDPDELSAVLKGKVPSYWMPDAYVAADELPRTSVGKIDKRELRVRHGS